MLRPITVVIPLVRAHDCYINELVASLIDEADLIEELILCRSGLSASEEATFHSLVRAAGMTAPIPVRALTTPSRQTAGENRNRGASEATTPFVAFMDADDAYAHGRLRGMVEVAVTHESNLVVHDFCVAEQDLPTWLGVSFTSTNIVSSHTLYETTFPNGRDRKKEGSVPGDTNLVLPPSLQANHSVSHGHTLVRTSVFDNLRFSRIYPGEDGQFCRDVLWKLGGVHYIPVKLSAYRSTLSAEAYSSPLDKAIRRIRATKEMGWRALRP